MNERLEYLANLLWGPATFILLLGCGAYFTIGTRFLPFRGLKAAFRFALKEEGEGEVSAFAALCTSLAATLGTGNIIGVATAISAGGPGALFWMVFAALLGCGTRYAEGFLAVRYRQKDAEGRFIGGPFFYLEHGLHQKGLAKIFAAACLLCCLLSMGTTSQINGIASAATSFFDPNGTHTLFSFGNAPVSLAALVTGAAVTYLAGKILRGGIRRISFVSARIVPLMAGLFTLLTLWMILQNYQKLPAALLLIFKSAFSPKAALGAGAGITLQKAIRFGLGRGIFSNEAGMGSDPIAAAAAKTDHPHAQGLVSMLGPFIDTVVLCSLTGLAIILTDVWQDPALSGAQITLAALYTLPLPKRLLSFLYFLCLLFFGFASIIGWSYYGEQSLRYLFPQKPPLRLFHLCFLIILFWGSAFSADLVWSLADILCALMTIPNLFGLLLLSPQVFSAQKYNYKFLYFENRP